MLIAAEGGGPPGDLSRVPGDTSLAELALARAAGEPVAQVGVTEEPYSSTTSSPPKCDAASSTATKVRAASLI